MSVFVKVTAKKSVAPRTTIDTTICQKPCVALCILWTVLDVHLPRLMLSLRFTC